MRAAGGAPPRPSAESSADRRPLAFFLLVLLLSLPFAVAGWLTGAMLLPGLPVAAMQAVCPAVAAVVLVAIRTGRAGVAAFLRRAFTAWPRGVQWPILLLGPPVLLAVVWLLQRALGVPVPLPGVDVGRIAVLFAVFLVSAVTEELGWSSYALEPLRDRWGPLVAAVVIGLAWAAMHVLALVQAGRDWRWIAWWVVTTLALRMLLVVIFARTGGGVMGVSLFHASYNVAWQSYPESGSYWDPALVGPVFAVVAAAAMVVDRRRRQGAVA
ncbi:CPBP family intramembrane glutamic endopeptidase [Agromyces aurantiacus]|uniref:CPBP family intramembrane glutamic endopeptidase n=1 Tax=Agromyces aurantiacus TaxID=165814 RepID=A0ABV9R245_9MICO|nr:CPBP family intramembrane glutamic endopeptidase [Agromyces aurantiacus]MBM7502871.1 membrane protease YdiL (CAAX protease family) [Agromyces aurantiacus]